VAKRARTNVDVIRRMAAGGDPDYTALEPVAADLDQAVREVDLLPASFWLPPNRGHDATFVSPGRPHTPRDPAATADTGRRGPNEAAAPKCVYMAIMSLDPTGQGHKRWTTRWKPALQAFDIAFDSRLSVGRR
jgi:hypothetical protein